MNAASRARLWRAAALSLLVAVAAPDARAGADPAPAPEPASAAAETRGPVTNLPLPRFVSMRSDSANARRGPSFDQRVDWEFVHRGLPLEVTGEYGHWRRVRDADGAGGWVHHTLLSGVRTAIVQGADPVPLQAGPDDGDGGAGDGRARGDRPGRGLRTAPGARSRSVVSRAGCHGRRSGASARTRPSSRAHVGGITPRAAPRSPCGRVAARPGRTRRTLYACEGPISTVSLSSVPVKRNGTW